MNDLRGNLFAAAAYAYGDLVDKAKEPLYNHALRVRSRVTGLLDEDVANAALFHDVIEDTEYEDHDLIAVGLTPRAVEIVDAVSRRDGETYADFTSRVIAHSLEATLVKLADVHDHIDPKYGISLPESLQVRYTREQSRLKEAAGAMGDLVLEFL